MQGENYFKMLLEETCRYDPPPCPIFSWCRNSSPETTCFAMVLASFPGSLPSEKRASIMSGTLGPKSSNTKQRCVPLGPSKSKSSTTCMTYGGRGCIDASFFITFSSRCSLSLSSSAIRIFVEICELRMRMRMRISQNITIVYSCRPLQRLTGDDGFLYCPTDPSGPDCWMITGQTTAPEKLHCPRPHTVGCCDISPHLSASSDWHIHPAGKSSVLHRYLR